MVESEIGLMVDGILYLVVLKSAQICTLVLTGIDVFKLIFDLSYITVTLDMA